MKFLKAPLFRLYGQFTPILGPKEHNCRSRDLFLSFIWLSQIIAWVSLEV